MKARAESVLNWVISLALLLLATLVFRPDGIGQAAIRHWRAERQQQITLSRYWPVLASGGTRLDEWGGDVRVAVFGDYQCPFCKRLDVALARLMKKYRIGVTYHYFPLSSHPAADAAARTAICAGRAGAFRALHRRLFTTTEWQADTNWVREAIAAGVADTAAFMECQHGAYADSILAADIAVARLLHVSGTPTIITASGMRIGVVSDAELEQIIVNAVQPSLRYDGVLEPRHGP